jgi:hypothetical protein
VDNGGSVHYTRDPQYLILAAVEKAPVLFFTCREARIEVMNVYRPFKGIKKGSGTVWFDPHTDVLCFRYKYFHASVHQSLVCLDDELRENLEHIAMSLNVIRKQWDDMHDDLALLLPSLKAIHLNSDYSDGPTDKRNGVIALKEVKLTAVEAIHFRLLRQAIVDTKTLYPKWKEPSIKQGGWVEGLAIGLDAGIGLGK